MNEFVVTCLYCGEEVTIHVEEDERGSADVWAAYSHTIKAAATVDGGHDIRRRILALIDSADARGGFVASIIGRELGLP